MTRTNISKRLCATITAAALSLLVPAPAEAATTTWVSPTQYGALCDGVNDDTAAFQSAINAAVAPVNYVIGGMVDVPAGTCMISRKLLVQDRAVLRGKGTEVSRIKAMSSFTAGYGGAMLELGNGTGDKWDYSFNSRIEDLTVDANDVSNLSGVWSEQANEGGGMLRAAVVNFRRYGFHGAAGTSSVTIDRTLFQGSDLGMLAGIRFDAWLQNGVKDCVIVGPSTGVGDGVQVSSSTVLIENLTVDRVTNGVKSVNSGGDGAILGITGSTSVGHLVDATAGAHWFIRDAVANGSAITIKTLITTRAGDVASATS